MDSLRLYFFYEIGSKMAGVLLQRCKLHWTIHFRLKKSHKRMFFAFITECFSNVQMLIQFLGSQYFSVKLVNKKNIKRWFVCLFLCQFVCLIHSHSNIFHYSILSSGSRHVRRKTIISSKCIYSKAFLFTVALLTLY